MKIIFSCVAIGLASLFLFVSDFFAIRNVDFNWRGEVQPLIREDLEPLLVQIKERQLKQNLWLVNIWHIQEDILNNSAVASVAVNRVWPSGLQIQVEAKQIRANMIVNKVAVAVLDDGSIYNSKIATAKMANSSLPWLAGSAYIDSVERRAAAVRWLEALDREGYIRSENISDISSDNEATLWVQLMNPRLKVKFESDLMPEKKIRAEKVLRYLNDRGLYARVIETDLDKKILVRRRDAP